MNLSPSQQAALYLLAIVAYVAAQTAVGLRLAGIRLRHDGMHRQPPDGQRSRQAATPEAKTGGRATDVGNFCRPLLGAPMTQRIDVSSVANPDDLRRQLSSAANGSAVIYQDSGHDVAVLIPMEAFRSVQRILKAVMTMPLYCWDDVQVCTMAHDDQ